MAQRDDKSLSVKGTWKVGDSFTLDEQVQEGFWRVKVNGQKNVMVLLVEVESDDKHRHGLVRPRFRGTDCEQCKYLNEIDLVGFKAHSSRKNSDKERSPPAGGIKFVKSDSQLSSPPKKKPGDSLTAGPRAGSRRTPRMNFDDGEPSGGSLPQLRKTKSPERERRMEMPVPKVIPNIPLTPPELAQAQSTLKQVEEEIGSLKKDLELIVKAWTSAYSVQPSEVRKEARLQVAKSPDAMMFERMLENPYYPQNQTFMPSVGIGAVTVINRGDSAFESKNDTNKEEVALAPARKLPVRFLLRPMFNLNVVSSEHHDMLTSLSFNVLTIEQSYHDEEECEVYLALLLMYMYIDLGLVKEFNIDEVTLFRFIMTICRKYRNVPFHNFFHAFNVTQTMYYFLTTGKCLTVLDRKDALAMITATLCHDLDHPGLNNGFLIQAGLKIGSLHKRSTLENHHLLVAMSILAQPECNIFANISPSDTQALGESIRDLILATDLSLHGVILRNMEARKKRIGKEYMSSKPFLDHEDRVSVMTMIMKCADLSNEIRDPEMANKWATRINREFFAQCDLEKRLNLKVSAWMDYKKIILAKEQMNFISGLCMPLYKCLAFVFPVIAECVDQMTKNHRGWEQRFANFYITPEQQQTAASQKESIWKENEAKGKDLFGILAKVKTH